jgi:aminoglycoside 2'-N-acetyltransferase I
MTDIDISFIPQDKLTEVEKTEIRVLLALAFKDDPVTDLEWAKPHFNFIARRQGSIVSYTGLLWRRVLVGGQAVTVGGIGGVATRPGQRGQGYARRLLEAATDYMRQDGRYEFVLLFCYDKRISYYTGLGYELIGNEPFYILSKGKRLKFTINRLILPLTSRAWPSGEVDLLGPPW